MEVGQKKLAAELMEMNIFAIAEVDTDVDAAEWVVDRVGNFEILGEILVQLNGCNDTADAENKISLVCVPKLDY